jgi:hypothetical protein
LDDELVVKGVKVLAAHRGLGCGHILGVDAGEPAVLGQKAFPRG